MKKIVDDVAALRPTLFIAVPRVLERIQSGIAGKINGQGPVAKILFGLAYKIKQLRLWMGSSVEGVSYSAYWRWQLCATYSESQCLLWVMLD